MSWTFQNGGALSARTGFARNPLQRHSEHRDEAATIAAHMADPAARSFVLAGEIPILKPAGEALSARWRLAEADALGEARIRAFLGLIDETPLFATLIPAERADALRERADCRVLDLRSLAVQGLLPADELGALGTAKALTFWHARHGFCANCGQPSIPTASGWRRDCPACGAQHFPRVDPVVIMLAVRGDKCLLGRQPRFTPNMYSCLAGFLEPGETIEDAVRREIMEEAGIAIGRVDYLCSQPWPFPSSLMIGCIAEALSDDIVIDRTELEDARWFTRDEARATLDGTHPNGIGSPPPVAIAHRLLKAFVEP